MWIPTGPPDVELEKFLLGVYADVHNAKHILSTIIPLSLTTIFCDLIWFLTVLNGLLLRFRYCACFDERKTYL